MNEMVFIGICADCIYRGICKDATKDRKVYNRKLPPITLSCSNYVKEGATCE